MSNILTIWEVYLSIFAIVVVFLTCQCFVLAISILDEMGRMRISWQVGESLRNKTNEI